MKITVEAASPEFVSIAQLQEGLVYRQVPSGRPFIVTDEATIVFLDEGTQYDRDWLDGDDIVGPLNAELVIR